jgi:hypothetical protein
VHDPVDSLVFAGTAFFVLRIFRRPFERHLWRSFAQLTVQFGGIAFVGAPSFAQWRNLVSRLA